MPVLRRSIWPVALLVVASGLFLLRFSRQPAAPTQLEAPTAGTKNSPEAARKAAEKNLPPAGSAVAGGDPQAARLATGTQLLFGAWGSRTDELGRRHEAEANFEGPMALLGGAAGEAVILDQVNRRVERFAPGQRTTSLSLGSDTGQDLALGPDGRTLVLDRLVEKNVQVYDRDGRLRNEVPLDEKEVGDASSLTGVFADRDGIYVEREHGKVLRIADLNGQRDRPLEELAGRPSRDGQLLISAAIVDRQAGQLGITAVQRSSGQPAFTQSLALGAPILHILLLDSDIAGRIYVAATTGHEAPAPPYQIYDEAIVAVQLGSGGAVRGRLMLPPLTGAEESLRPLSVDDSGAILVMRTQPEGLSVTRYVFP